MITVDKSTEIELENEKNVRKISTRSLFVTLLGFALSIIGVFFCILTKASPTVQKIIAYSAVALIFGGVAIDQKIVDHVAKKLRDGFLAELSSEGFKCDRVFDAGMVTYYNGQPDRSGSPAVMAVDYQQRKAAIMFYENPYEPYVIPAELITDVWSGVDGFGEYLVAAGFGFSVNDTDIIIPTLIEFLCKPPRMDIRIREKYNNGKVSKKFIEAVEKADDFAKVLKSLTALN